MLNSGSASRCTAAQRRQVLRRRRREFLRTVFFRLSRFFSFHNDRWLCTRHPSLRIHVLATGACGSARCTIYTNEAEKEEEEEEEVISRGPARIDGQWTTDERERDVETHQTVYWRAAAESVQTTTFARRAHYIYTHAHTAPLHTRCRSLGRAAHASCSRIPMPGSCRHGEHERGRQRIHEPTTSCFAGTYHMLHCYFIYTHTHTHEMQR
ncbi:unnamed protein product [Trichogramma brassicae]|uniref:Uncharacterized protein n=1 Tax=Trichogramma brassicae TaxID=86971 RepID=A0A6H5I7W4_9HYME|nr:unnamed protein product [Trichogramma brassicae]